MENEYIMIEILSIILPYKLAIFKDNALQ